MNKTKKGTRKRRAKKQFTKRSRSYKRMKRRRGGENSRRTYKKYQQGPRKSGRVRSVPNRSVPDRSPTDFFTATPKTPESQDDLNIKAKNMKEKVNMLIKERDAAKADADRLEVELGDYKKMYDNCLKGLDEALEADDQDKPGASFRSNIGAYPKETSLMNPKALNRMRNDAQRLVRHPPAARIHPTGGKKY